MFCAISYHLYNLNNVKSTHGRVLLLVKLLLGCLSCFLNCTNTTKWRNASHIFNKEDFRKKFSGKMCKWYVKVEPSPDFNEVPAFRPNLIGNFHPDNLV